MLDMVVEPFLKMDKYHDDIHETVDPPYEIYYFAIHISLLLFRYKKKMEGITPWNKLFDLEIHGDIMYLYWERVHHVFKCKQSTVKQVYLSQTGLWDDHVVGHRARIRCGNGACNVDYYQHRYNTHAFNHWGLPKVGDWYRCKGCKVVYYCSRRCQKVDWNSGNHKEICRRLNA